MRSEYYQKYDNLKEPSDAFLLENLHSKLMKNFHIIISISNLSFYTNLIQHYPQFETKCDVIFLEGLSNAGFKQFGSNYFSWRDISDEIGQNEEAFSN